LVKRLQMCTQMKGYLLDHGRTNITKGDKIDDRSHRAQVKLRFNLAHNYKPD